MSVLLPLFFLLVTVITGEIVSMRSYVTHGRVSWEGENFVDFSDYSSSPKWNADVQEIGAFAEGEDFADPIDGDTPGDAVLASVPDLAVADYPELYDGTEEGLYNIRLGFFGTLFEGSYSYRQTQIPTEREECSGADGFCRSFHWEGEITLDDWNSAQGFSRATCVPDDGGWIEISATNLIPFGVYTLWSVGCTNCRTDNEEIFTTPLGGLPNAYLTRPDTGCLYANIKLPYCPLDDCEEGGTCLLYISAIFHSGDTTNGASPHSATLQKCEETDGVPQGVGTHAHLIWIVNGDVDEDVVATMPTHTFDEPQTCDDGEDACDLPECEDCECDCKRK